MAVDDGADGPDGPGGPGGDEAIVAAEGGGRGLERGRAEGYGHHHRWIGEHGAEGRRDDAEGLGVALGAAVRRGDGAGRFGRLAGRGGAGPAGGRVAELR